MGGVATDSHATEAATTDAVAAQAQGRDQPSGGAGDAIGVPAPDAAASYTVNASVVRRTARPPQHLRDMPLYRPLRIYTIDPGASRMDGAIATVNVPFEKLEPGPCGRLFRVDSFDGAAETDYIKADLDSPFALLKGGYDPSPSDPRFHQQMLYAVCCNVYAAFRTALGRDLSWGFARDTDTSRLILRPHAFRGANAFYDKQEGALQFGYVELAAMGEQAPRGTAGFVFTCLSHDIVAHEMTHAVLDGLRSNFSVASGPDIAAFHEGFADLVAIFQRLSYRDLVRAALRKARGAPEQADTIIGLARQVGQLYGDCKGLRSAISAEPPPQYDATLPPHELGAILVSAVFEAFIVVYRRKTARFIRLATQGSGVLPPGELPADLLDVLSERVARLASQFLSLLIRAIDYCPPVDMRFGEYLRALVTADSDLVPDDPWGYREALIDGFARHSIHPRHVLSLTEDALLWRPPTNTYAPLAGLAFGQLAFEGDPANAAGPKELLRQAHLLGEFVARPEHASEFGLLCGPAGPIVPDKPRVDSIRSARRIGPDGQVSFDLVAEITQRCKVAAADGQPGFETWGGATVILGPDGAIRYAISKNVTGSDRLERRRSFLQSAEGGRFWSLVNGQYLPTRQFFGLLHPESASQKSRLQFTAKVRPRPA